MRAMAREFPRFSDLCLSFLLYLQLGSDYSIILEYVFSHFGLYLSEVEQWLYI